MTQPSTGLDAKPHNSARGRQRQFLQVCSEEEAHRRIHSACAHLAPKQEAIDLATALGRVLATDARAPVCVPAFDRSNFDGFCVRAADTYGAEEQTPRRLRLLEGARAAGAASPGLEVGPGEALAIATGAVIPRGADAVVMVEDTTVTGNTVEVTGAVAPGQNVAWAGTDIGQGEVILRAGQRLSSRETGLLAAAGLRTVTVYKRPRVVVLSTGDEVRPPGVTLRIGEVYDSNQRIVSDAVRELGGEAIELGILPDCEETVAAALRKALTEEPRTDLLVLSGGTSKGAGDLNTVVIAALAKELPESPGIILHGVALKPGKPLCVAILHGRPVVVLPGFPTSAIFTFHDFIAPVIRRLAGRAEERRAVIRATAPIRIPSASGRTEYVLVSLIPRVAGEPGEPRQTGPRAPTAAAKTLSGSTAAAAPPDDHDEASAHKPGTACGGPAGRGLAAKDDASPARDLTPTYAAYPLGAGSGSLSTFSRAAGYIRIPRHTDYIPAGSPVEVQPLGTRVSVPDLVAVGSHCTGLDWLLSELGRSGFSVQLIALGSQGGLEALRRGEGDVAGIHLLCEKTGTYNTPLLPAGIRLCRGYGRRQGLCFRQDDARFSGLDLQRFHHAISQPGVRMVNRNRGAGTRILIDRFLSGAETKDEPRREPHPEGYHVQAKSHHAVAAAIAQGRADWGMTLDVLAHAHDLGFLFVQEERFDLAIPEARWDRPAVRALRDLLADPATQRELSARGFVVSAPLNESPITSPRHTNDTPDAGTPSADD